MGTVSRDRWPGWVYAEGEEPDYRFSLANERTFLAWLRTTLAFIAAGVAIDVLDIGVSEGVSRAISALLLGLGVITPVAAFARWAAAERSLRHAGPLPPLGLLAIVIAGTVLLTAAVLAVIVVLL